MGVSLGAVNYRLRALIDRGIVKASNFSRSSSELGHAYALTPSGIAEKTLLTGRFLKRKIAEYEALTLEIEVLSQQTVIGPWLDNPADN